MTYAFHPPPVIAAFLICVTACSDPESSAVVTSTSIEKTIVAAAGGLVVVGPASISIPPGALSADAQVEIEINSDDPPAGVVGPMVTIEPEHEILSVPALIAINVPTPIADYVLVRMDGNQFVPLNNLFVDTIASEVQAESTQLGKFTIVDRRSGVALTQPARTTPARNINTGRNAGDEQSEPRVLVGEWNGQGEYAGVNLHMTETDFIIEQAGSVIRSGDYTITSDRVRMTDALGRTQNTRFQLDGGTLYLHTSAKTIGWIRATAPLFNKGPSIPGPTQARPVEKTTASQPTQGGFFGELRSRLGQPNSEHTADN